MVPGDKTLAWQDECLCWRNRCRRDFGKAHLKKSYAECAWDAAICPEDAPSMAMRLEVFSFTAGWQTELKTYQNEAVIDVFLFDQTAQVSAC
jgi:hypothetical protein